MTQWWRRLLNLDRVEVLTAELQHSTRHCLNLTDERDKLAAALEREKEKRIAAETLSAERARELDRMREEIAYLRTQNASVLAERLKSLDAINVKLMEPRVEPPPPDFEKLRQERAARGEDPVQAAAAHMIDRVRQTHRQMDLAILGALHPQALGRRAAVRPVNEPMAPTMPAQDAEPIVSEPTSA